MSHRHDDSQRNPSNSHPEEPVPYPHPAGGWGALKSSAKHLIQSEDAAKGVKTLLKANQPGGFDCPGCAWGEEPTAGKIDFCENGVKAVAWEVTSKRADADFFARHSLAELRSWSDYALEKSGRLCEPMFYDGEHDHYQPVSWGRAFQLIAGELNALASPDEALFYTSGRASNEVAYLYQLFGRAFGTNNFPDCSNMCHEASGVGLGLSIGTGKGTVTMHDFEQAEAIFVFGQNPGTNHPRMLATLRKAAKRGAQVVAINNLKERGLQRFSDPQSPKEMLIGSSTAISQHYVTPRLGGDMALLRGMAKFLFEQEQEQDQTDKGADTQGVIDRDFIAQHCDNFDAYEAVVKATPWAKIIAQSGLEQQEIEKLGRIYMSSERSIFTWAMGITQHRHSVATVRELVNLLLMKGNIGKPGAGACPVRGHSNVQGNRTVGINERPPAELLDALQQRYDFAIPRQQGLNTVESIQAMLDHKARVFIGLGGNFAAATPDTAQTHRALSHCALTVHISTKLNRSHVITGQKALILPCLGRTEIDRQASGEQIITVEDSMSMVHSSQGSNEPAAPSLRSETAIVAGIAQATLRATRQPAAHLSWLSLADDYQLIREEISQVLPGFEDFNERIRQKRGFHLTNSAALREWRTATQRAVFSDSALPEALMHEQDQQHRAANTGFTLQTLRSHDQYNTTIYGMNDRYRGISGERNVLFMNPDDIKQQGLTPGDRVDITTVNQPDSDNRLRQVKGFKVVEFQIPRGCLAAYYPETNPLVPLDSVAEGCGTPTYKSIAVQLTPGIRQE
ncbi:FdhF/YdeP family oxidoreductase [Aestuariicella hydrocarbonica]|uniref:FdhF/YdeP family oxidoreductase n=1 Tax=Pseudomaricurvus hydrocarbonicus TaxID=1470433 RepID=A0A9E5MNI1_9GAMM|nr:FdhF/YdeP family oxidoreductase [Aestuariicella hydrocarbonica]NHO67437.1 FdhF/YdeP family oxidoreductase [Aestuariicella hydrocarbonica]